MSLTLQTTHGNIKIELFCELCPKACKNFLALAASGKYDNTIFHRNIRGISNCTQDSLFKVEIQPVLARKVKVSIVNHSKTSLFKVLSMTAEACFLSPTVVLTQMAANSSSLTTGFQNSTNNTQYLVEYFQFNQDN